MCHCDRNGRRDSGMDDAWLHETVYGCTDEDADRFIHNMDGSSPAVRLMLLVEKILYAPRIRRSPHSALAGLDGADEQSRRRIIDVASGMDTLTERKSTKDPVKADFTRWWVLEPGETASAACFRRLYGKPDEPGGAQSSGRMMGLMGFAIRNEAWASRLAGVLESYCAASAAVDGIRVASDVQDTGSGIVGGGLVPERCSQALACMLCSAFNGGHGPGEGDGMVSPLSVTLSMIVSRCLDAGSAPALPMVADGLYGRGRDPMDDLESVLGYAAGHPRKASSTRNAWTDPGVLSILPGGSFVSGSAGNVVCLDSDRADDAGMFALLTHPLFPSDADKAVDEVEAVLSRICERMPGNGGRKRHFPNEPVHFPLLAWPVFSKLAGQPPRMIEFLKNPELVRVAMRCDHDPYERSDHASIPLRTADRMLCSGEEAKSQRRGMVMAGRIVGADWSHHDVRGMVDIVRAFSPPPYDVTGDPLDSLKTRSASSTMGRWRVTDFLAYCMDAGRMGLAADMLCLEDLMACIDGKLGRGGSAPLDWRLYGKWRLSTSGTGFTAMLGRFVDDDAVMPDVFIVNDVLSGFACHPCADGDRLDPRASRFRVMMESESLDNGDTLKGSEYEVLIDWGA